MKLFLIDGGGCEGGKETSEGGGGEGEGGKETKNECLERLERSFSWQPGKKRLEVIWTNWNAKLLSPVGNGNGSNKKPNSNKPVLILCVLCAKVPKQELSATSSSIKTNESFESSTSDDSGCFIESNSILSDLAREFEEQKLADRWMIVNRDSDEGGGGGVGGSDTSLPFNQTIVELRTPVLAAAFRKSFRERSTGELDFRSVWSAKATTEMLRYVYTDDVENLRENAVELLKMSHVYELHGLFDMCEKSLLDQVQTNGLAVPDLLAVFMLAYRYCRGSYVGLFEAALAELSMSLYEAKCCDKWQQFTKDREVLEVLRSHTQHDPEWNM